MAKKEDQDLSPLGILEAEWDRTEDRIKSLCDNLNGEIARRDAATANIERLEGYIEAAEKRQRDLTRAVHVLWDAEAKPLPDLLQHLEQTGGAQ